MAARRLLLTRLKASLTLAIRRQEERAGLVRVLTDAAQSFAAHSPPSAAPGVEGRPRAEKAEGLQALLAAEGKLHAQQQRLVFAAKRLGVAKVG